MKQSRTMQKITKGYTDLGLLQIINKFSVIKVGNLVFAEYAPSGRLYEVKGFYLLSSHCGPYDSDKIMVLVKPAYNHNCKRIKNAREQLICANLLLLPNINNMIIRMTDQMNKTTDMIGVIKKANS